MNSYDQTTDRIAALARIILDGGQIDRAQARELTLVSGDALYDLFFWANKIRIKFTGHAVKFCSIVAGKVGNCSEDCGFCSQSKHHNTHVQPGMLSVDEMVGAMQQAVDNGANSFGIVNSGRGPTDKELDWLEAFYDRVTSEGKIRPCATLGELTEAQAARLKSMGVLRVNHNLESSRRHFPNICSTHTYDDRVNTIKIAKAAGLSVCSGGIFGLGEVWEDRLDMAFDLRDLGADVVPINFLNRIAGTPLHAVQRDLPPMEALQIISIYRFLLPEKELKIAGGREVILRDLQSWIFFAGGNSFLIGNYLTTFGRGPEQDHQMLRDLGLAFTTFDEVEHEAPLETAPGPRLSDSRVALPIVQ
ncbi:MAG: biotin synthase BioB [Phycisphaeraceae bacterium]